MLWLDVVRPTIRVFTLDLTASPVPHSSVPRNLLLHFPFSPLLMSLSSSSPGRVVAHEPTSSYKVYEGLPPPFPELPNSGARSFNAKWVVCVDTCYETNNATTTRTTTTTGNSSSTSSIRNSNRISDGIARMSVAPLKGGFGGGTVGGDGATCDVDRAVVVDVPMVPGCLVVRAYMDQSVNREVVLAQITRSGAALFVVDMEETCNSRKLVVLSTERCDFPSAVDYSFSSLVVLRNWDDPSSPSYGSRTFLVKAILEQRRNEILKFTEGGASSSPDGFIQCDNIDDVFRLSDSLFCVSSCLKEGSFRVYHRDNATQPLDLIQGTKLTPWKFRVTAESGLIFKVFFTRIEVIEPTSGCVVLTINFPYVKWIHLSTPFSLTPYCPWAPNPAPHRFVVCGGRSALLLVMGPSHALHLARHLLWSRLVLPTLAGFALAVAAAPASGADRGACALLSFVVSPVLLSVAGGPSWVPCAWPPFASQLVDARHVAWHSFLGIWTVCDLLTGAETGVKPPTGTQGVMPGGKWAVSSKWGVSATQGWNVIVGVVSMSRVLDVVVAGGGGGGDKEEEEDKLDGGCFVFVSVPVVEEDMYVTVDVHIDNSHGSEAIIAQTTRKCVVFFVVDLEQTFNSRRLVVLSTTRWAFPTVDHSFLQCVVMRTRRSSNTDASSVSRVFIVRCLVRGLSSSTLFRVEEGTGASQAIMITHQDGYEVFNVQHVTDSLFCVSSCLWNDHQETTPCTTVMMLNTQ
ncbi:hypothetical protein Pelo_4536 [Pelomyxa schiedti]|nr:hypothetical protein Pelo_4536 [Pelomyxa schiedti]